MKTPSKSRAKFGKDLDWIIVEFIWLILEVVFVILSGL